jgi:hypothetical protein
MKGKWVALTPARQFMCDLLRAARAVPSVSVEHRMDLGRLKAARDRLDDRPAWAALFAKAYATVARDVPAMRQAYVKFPWPHFCEYPISVVAVAVERDLRGEKVVVFRRIKEPEAKTLDCVTRLIRECQTEPADECRELRRVLRLGRLPAVLRRLAWWFGLNAGRPRGNHFGTFAISVYSRPGPQSLHPLSPCTGTLNFGRIDDDGLVTVRLVYDHRVVDGSTVARFMEAMEACLNGPLAAELIALAVGRRSPGRSDTSARLPS